MPNRKARPVTVSAPQKGRSKVNGHVALAATPRYARSVLEYAAKSAAADAFRLLAKEIMLSHVAS